MNYWNNFAQSICDWVFVFYVLYLGRTLAKRDQWVLICTLVICNSTVINNRSCPWFQRRRALPILREMLALVDNHKVAHVHSAHSWEMKMLNNSKHRTFTPSKTISIKYTWRDQDPYLKRIELKLYAKHLWHHKVNTPVKFSN